MEPDYRRAAGLLGGARKVVVFTGAGMSKDSGVETFRGPGGIWERFSAQDLATYDGFLRDPVKVWTWYEHRRTQVSQLAAWNLLWRTGKVVKQDGEAVDVTPDVAAYLAGWIEKEMPNLEWSEEQRAYGKRPE